MSVKLLQYKGTGIVSKLIQFQTRSRYSHTALQFSDGKVCEAWHTGGERFWHGSVRWLDDPFQDHSSTTEIDVYRIDGYINEEKARAFAEAQIGKKYDFWTVARFLSRRPAPVNFKWYCTELSLHTLLEGELEFLHGNFSHLTPRDIPISPLGYYECTLYALDN